MQKIGLKRRISEINENDDNDSNDQLDLQTEPFGVDKRRSRNENEKKRRDKFNELIDDLATLLNRDHKIDKSTTLLETYNFFRSCSNIDEQQTKTETSTKWKPTFLKNDEFVKIMCDFRGSFFLVFGLNGVITYVSESITPLLGYMTRDVIEQSLFDYLDDKSSKSIQSALKKNKYNISDNVTFQCNWKRSNVFESKYETVKINGIFKRCLINNVSNGYFITVANIETFLRINELYHNDIADREFTSDFSMDFKFINLDQRAIQIIGFSSIEIMGTSGYDYCHIDDIDELIECHKLLMKCGQSTSSVYRFRTKGHQWIFLQTHYTLKFSSSSSRNESSDQAHSIHCTHHFINSNDVLMSKNSIMCTRNSIDSDNGIRMQQLNDSTQCSTATNDDDLMTANASPPPPPLPPQQISKIDVPAASAAAIKAPTNNNNYQKTNNQSIRSIMPSMDQLTNKLQPLQQATNDEVIKTSKSSSSIEASLIDQQQFQNNASSSTILNTTPTTTTNINNTDSISSSMNTNSLQNSKLTVNNNLLLKLIIFSHQQPAFREYVCKQFIQQKEKLEMEIRQKQDRVNELNEMMKFFQDDKKLEQWAIDMKTQSSSSDNQQKAQSSNMMNELTHESFNSHISNTGLHHHHQSAAIGLDQQQQFYNNRTLRQHPNAATLHHLAATANLNPAIHPLASYFQNQNLLNRNPHEIMNHHHPTGDDEIDVEALDRLLSEYSLKQFDQFVTNFHR